MTARKKVVDSSVRSGERFATLEAQLAAVSERVEGHARDDKEIHATMVERLDSIQKVLARQAGFVAGITFAATAIAAALGFALKYIFGK